MEIYTNASSAAKSEALRQLGDILPTDTVRAAVFPFRRLRYRI